ncbi:SDR family oxidoreductase [Sphingomonas sp. MMS24-J13]|uniref:SDR family oxidoreductase n=1 Tax=Sphingomonas sp. MMS24-J13 TaxID=3238686 RepID=UPI003850C656
MMGKFTGKTAFITGGASGMGLGMAQSFANAGMRVVMADIRQDALDDAMKMFGTTNLAVGAVQLDVTDRAGWIEAAEKAEAMFGNIHVLVNNAGVGLTGMLDAMTYKDWDFSLGVNLGGVVNGVTAMLPRIKAHGEGGHVLATSSTAGIAAVAGAGMYCAAKYAVTGLMETLASELQGTNIGASVFIPGPVNTNLGATTDQVRPAHLRNEAAGFDPLSPPEFDASVFMSKEEVGDRVLRGMERGDLYIITHPEFREGIKARNDALLRAIPDEPIDTARADVIRTFGTLLHNPIYDGQMAVPGWTRGAE